MNKIIITFVFVNSNTQNHALKLFRIRHW